MKGESFGLKPAARITRTKPTVTPHHGDDHKINTHRFGRERPGLLPGAGRRKERRAAVRGRTPSLVQQWPVFRITSEPFLGSDSAFYLWLKIELIYV